MKEGVSGERTVTRGTTVTTKPTRRYSPKPQTQAGEDNLHHSQTLQGLRKLVGVPRGGGREGSIRVFGRLENRRKLPKKQRRSLTRKHSKAPENCSCHRGPQEWARVRTCGGKSCRAWSSEVSLFLLLWQNI